MSGGHFPAAGFQVLTGIMGCGSAWSRMMRPSRNLDDALAVGGDVVLVGDQDDGDALAVEFLEDGHDLDAGAGIEVAGGFVGQHHGRLVDQGAGDGHPLLLAAGKLVGIMVGTFGQPHPFQRLAGQLDESPLSARRE